MEDRTKLSKKDYMLTIVFAVKTKAGNMVAAENQAWLSRLAGNGNLEPVNVEVERIGEH